MPVFISRFIAYSLLAALVGAGVLPTLVLAGDASSHTQSGHNETLALPNMSKKVDVAIESLPIGQALEALAAQGPFNLVRGEGLDQSVSFAFHNVPLGHVLLALKQMGQLYYLVEDNTLYVSQRRGVAASSIHQRTGHLIEVKFLPASLVADFLNQTLFYTSGEGAMQAAVADPISNTVILNVDDSEAKRAANLVNTLDVPREKLVWNFNYQNVLEAAEALAASVFQNGSSPLILSQGGSGGGGASAGGGNAGGGLAASPGANTQAINQITVDQSSIVEGQGTEQLTAMGETSTNGKKVIPRSQQVNTQQLSLGSQGPVLLPDTRTNTLTFLGTAQQVAQARSFLETFDRQRQQVYLELSIIELSDSLTKLLTPSVQATLGKSGITLGFNAALNNRSTAGYVNPIQTTSNFNAALNFLHQEGKLKVMARPSVLTMHEEEAHISVVDEVIQGFSNVSDQNNNIVAQVPNVTGAGISLNILPRIAPNGDVSLRVNPVISFPQPNIVNNIQLISLREMVAQNIVLREGESFVLGGLKQQVQQKVKNTVPGLGQIPVLGNLFSSFDGRNDNKELLIMITPHVRH